MNATQARMFAIQQEQEQAGPEYVVTVDGITHTTHNVSVVWGLVGDMSDDYLVTVDGTYVDHRCAVGDAILSRLEHASEPWIGEWHAAKFQEHATMASRGCLSCRTFAGSGRH